MKAFLATLVTVQPGQAGLPWSPPPRLFCVCFSLSHAPHLAFTAIAHWLVSRAGAASVAASVAERLQAEHSKAQVTPAFCRAPGCTLASASSAGRQSGPCLPPSLSYAAFTLNHLTGAARAGHCIGGAGAAGFAGISSPA